MIFLQMSTQFRCSRTAAVFFWCFASICQMVPPTYSREVYVGLQTGYFGLGRIFTEEPILQSNSFEFPPNSTAFSHGSVPSDADDVFLPVSGAVYVGNINFTDDSAFRESAKGKIVVVSFYEFLHHFRKGYNPLAAALTAFDAGAIAMAYTIPALDISFTINSSVFNTVVRTKLPIIWITPEAYLTIYEHRYNLTLTIIPPSSPKVFRYCREALYSLNAYTSLIFFWALILLASLFSVVTRTLLRARKLSYSNDILLLASALLSCFFSTYMIYSLSDLFGGRGQLAYVVTGASHILFLASGALSPIMLITLWWASLWNDSEQLFVSQKNMTRIIAVLLCCMWCLCIIQHILETKTTYGPTTFILALLIMSTLAILAIYFGFKFAERLREASKLTVENGFSRDKKWEKQLQSAIRKTGFVVITMAVIFILFFPVVIAGFSAAISVFFSFFLFHLLAITVCFVTLITIIPPVSKLWQKK